MVLLSSHLELGCSVVNFKIPNEHLLGSDPLAKKCTCNKLDVPYTI